MSEKIDAIGKKVIAIIREQLSLEVGKEIKLTDALAGDLGADSLDMAEAIMTLEESFDIEISDKDAEDIVTVQDVIDVVKGKNPA